MDGRSGRTTRTTRTKKTPSPRTPGNRTTVASTGGAALTETGELHFTATDGTSTADHLTITALASDNQVRDTTAFRKRRNAFEEAGEEMFTARDMREVFSFLYDQKGITLGDKLGAGNYSEVYRGTNRRKRNRLLAVKVIKMSDQDGRARNYTDHFLASELAIIAKLRHPRIVRTYSLCQVANKVIVVMEYAAQGTLSDIVTRVGALLERTAALLFREVLRGLAFMHQQHSIAHRDLKLENILVTERNVPKLADFSFSMVFDGRTLCDQFCGTPPYFPPEMWRKQPYNPLRSDMWSVGVCLFIITNDKYPFAAFDRPELILRQQCDRLFTFREKTVAKYSVHYKPLVRKLLEPDPELRLDVGEASANQWFGVAVET